MESFSDSSLVNVSVIKRPTRYQTKEKTMATLQHEYPSIEHIHCRLVELEKHNIRFVAIYFTIGNQMANGQIRCYTKCS